MNATTEKRGAEVQRRLAELRDRGTSDALDAAERSALHFLDACGIETLASTIHCTGKDKYAMWAAETIVWTVRRLRAKEYREAIRGWGQLREYRGSNGGFLPVGLSDHAIMIQNAIENLVAR
jgi:hypothetical protein